MTLTGHFVYGHESREFTPCDTQEVYWVADGTGGDMPAVYQALAAQPYEPIYAEVRGSVGPRPDAGFADSYDRQLRIVELIRAARESAGCDEDLSGIAFRALGVEPFWDLKVTAAGMELRRLGLDTLQLEVQEFTETSESLRWSGVADTGQPFTVEFVEGRCTDPMSGSVFPYNALLVVGEGRLSGCAYAGAPR